MARNSHAPTDRTKTLVAIIIGLLSIVVSTFYSILTYKYGTGENAGLDAITNGILLSVLLACLGFLLDLTYSHSSAQGVLQGIIHLVDNRKVLDAIKDNKARLVKIENQMSGDQQGLDIGRRISGFPEVIQETAERTFNNYLYNFRLLEDGFEVAGEDWSLRSYYFFWECLLEEQVKRRGGNDGLVVRITHSNSIRIWLSENKNDDVSNLLTLQQSFYDAGGRIARVFIGNSPEPNDDYKRVLERMRNSKMDAFYLKPEVLSMRYDFLWVSDLDYVVKWYSGAGGESLGACEILKVQEPAARELRSKWASLWRQLIVRKGSLQPYFTPAVERLYDI